MVMLPDWQEFEGKSVEELLAPYPFWSHLTSEERDRRYQICMDVRDSDGDGEEEYYAIASLAAVRMDIQSGVYEPWLWGDLLRDYWFGPAFAAVPGLQDLDYDANGDFYEWVGQLADHEEPPWMLARAASTSNFNQRLIALRNPHTPPAVLAAFADWGLGTYEGGVAAFYVAMNPSTPGFALRAVAERVGRSPEEEEDFGNDLLSVALLNPNCPSEVLVQAAEHEDWSVRFQVAHSVAAPDEILDRLASDDDARIANAARSNPMLFPRKARDSAGS